MDMQMQLVKEGYAVRYASPEARYLPRWANYRGLAYGTTLEPVVFVYNKQLVTGGDIPHDRAELAALITQQRSRFAGKVTGFDLNKSGVGYMFAVQDKANYPGLDRLWTAFGNAGFQASGGTGDMLVGVNQGKYLLGYNMMGAYALSRSKMDLPNLGVVYPDEYTLALSRIVFISKDAAHPNAARLWLDYLLSARGQKVLGDAIELYPVRSNVDAAFSADVLKRELGARLRPIPIDMRLTDALDPKVRDAVLAGWTAAIAPTAPPVAVSKARPRRLAVVVDGIEALRNFPVLLAEKLGYLRSTEFDVTLMDIRPDIGVDEMVANGSADASIAYWHHAVAMHAAGKPMTSVVTLGVTPGAKLMVAMRLAGRVRAPSDLKGLRIVAGGPYSAKTTVANAVVMAGGNGPGDFIRLAPEDKPSIAAMLRDGRADLVVARTPDGRYYERAGVATLFADLASTESTQRTLGALFPTNSVYMLQSRVDEDPAAAQHLATAFVKALAYIRTHSAEEVTALLPPTFIGKDRAEFLAALAECMAMYQTDGRMPASAADLELKVLQAAIPAYSSVQASQTWTNVFVDRALAGTGK